MAMHKGASTKFPLRIVLHGWLYRGRPLDCASTRSGRQGGDTLGKLGFVVLDEMMSIGGRRRGKHAGKRPMVSAHGPSLKMGLRLRTWADAGGMRRIPHRTIPKDFRHHHRKCIGGASIASGALPLRHVGLPRTEREWNGRVAR